MTLLYDRVKSRDQAGLAVVDQHLRKKGMGRWMRSEFYRFIDTVESRIADIGGSVSDYMFDEWAHEFVKAYDANGVDVPHEDLEEGDLEFELTAAPIGTKIEYDQPDKLALLKKLDGQKFKETTESNMNSFDEFESNIYLNYTNGNFTAQDGSVFMEDELKKLYDPVVSSNFDVNNLEKIEIKARVKWDKKWPFLAGSLTKKRFMKPSRKESFKKIEETLKEMASLFSSLTIKDPSTMKTETDRLEQDIEAAETLLTSGAAGTAFTNFQDTLNTADPVEAGPIGKLVDYFTVQGKEHIKNLKDLTSENTTLRTQLDTLAESVLENTLGGYLFDVVEQKCKNINEKMTEIKELSTKFDETFSDYESLFNKREDKLEDDIKKYAEARITTSKEFVANLAELNDTQYLKYKMDVLLGLSPQQYAWTGMITDTDKSVFGKKTDSKKLKKALANHVTDYVENRKKLLKSAELLQTRLLTELDNASASMDDKLKAFVVFFRSLKSFRQSALIKLEDAKDSSGNPIYFASSSFKFVSGPDLGKSFKLSARTFKKEFKDLAYIEKDPYKRFSKRAILARIVQQQRANMAIKEIATKKKAEENKRINAAKALKDDRERIRLALVREANFVEDRKKRLQKEEQDRKNREASRIHSEGLSFIDVYPVQSGGGSAFFDARVKETLNKQTIKAQNAAVKGIEYPLDPNPWTERMRRAREYKDKMEKLDDAGKKQVEADLLAEAQVRQQRAVKAVIIDGRDLTTDDFVRLLNVDKPVGPGKDDVVSVPLYLVKEIKSIGDEKKEMFDGWKDINNYTKAKGIAVFGSVLQPTELAAIQPEFGPTELERIRDAKDRKTLEKIQADYIQKFKKIAKFSRIPSHAVTTLDGYKTGNPSYNSLFASLRTAFDTKKIYDGLKTEYGNLGTIADVEPRLKKYAQFESTLTDLEEFSDAFKALSKKSQTKFTELYDQAEFDDQIAELFKPDDANTFITKATNDFFDVGAINDATKRRGVMKEVSNTNLELDKIIEEIEKGSALSSLFSSSRVAVSIS